MRILSITGRSRIAALIFSSSPQFGQCSSHCCSSRWRSWAAQRSAAASGLAIGACIFMLSDSVIAVSRFVAPVPWASLWILASYYAAQLLMVLHFPDRPAAPAQPAA